MDSSATNSYQTALATIERRGHLDRWVIAITCLIGFVLSSIFDLFEHIYELAHEYESFELDELFLLSLFVSLGLILYGLRRNRELQRINRLIEHYATTDSLTGLLNRGYISSQLEHELAVAQRYQQTLSLLWLDLDDFKQINDTAGHVQADKLLQRMAEVIQSDLRESDLIGRMGGDEFLLLLPSTKRKEAQQVAERLLGLIQAVEVGGQERSVQLSASIGLTQYHPGETVEELLHRLDKAMYAAKRAGKGSVLALD